MKSQIKALRARERVLRQNSRETLTTIVVLAGVLQDQGKYDEAEKLNRRVLKGMEKELGIHHPDVLASVNNLALVPRGSGKLRRG